jgi:putative addiction module killer protein
MKGAMELRRYLTESGRDVLGQWLEELKDLRTRAKIVARIDRLTGGNFGDCKSLRGGLFELRIDSGPGYRIYYAMVGRTGVLLLCGGDKRKQSSDIKRAQEYFEDYRKRTQ